MTNLEIAMILISICQFLIILYLLGSYLYVRNLLKSVTTAAEKMLAMNSWMNGG